jgi:AcrR family transcriptional regulator
VTQDVDQWLKDLVRLTDEDDENRTEKQTRILEAAIEIFSEKGYAATSTSEIAQRAGVAEGTIFRHYKTKKDLLLTIVGPIMAKLVAPFFMRDFTKLLDKPYERVEDFYRAIARDRLVFARQNIKLLKILIHEVPFNPELQGHVMNVFSQHVMKRLERLVKHFQDEGQLIEGPTWRVIRSTISTIIGLVVTHVFLVPAYPIDDEEEINWAIDVLMHGLAKRN